MPILIARRAFLRLAGAGVCAAAAHPFGWRPVAAQGGTLNVGVTTMLERLDPQQGGTETINQIALTMFERLTEMDETGQLIPSLAEEWAVSSDGKSVTFALRDDVSFQSGDPLTADAVKFSIERTVDPATESRYAERLAGIERVDVVDPTTVRIQLKDVDPIFLYTLRSALFIVSPRAIEEHPDDFIEHGAGTGPFVFERFVPGEEIAVTRNDEYWDGAPPLDGVVFRNIPDDVTRLVELRSGNVHLISQVPRKDVAALESEGMQIFKESGFEQDYYTFNLADPIMSDLKVRQAINYGIDRNLIVERVYYGLAEVSTTGVPPSSWGHNAEVAGYAYDPERAKALLEEAGWTVGNDGIRTKDGQPLVLDMPTPPEEQRLAEVIQALLQEVGIGAELRVMESASYWDAVRQGDYDLGFWVRNVGHPDPAAYFIYFDSDEHWFTSQVPLPEVEALLEEGLRAGSQEERKAAYDEIQQILVDQAVVAWIAHAGQVYVARPDVQGLQFPSDAIFRLGHVSLAQ